MANLARLAHLRSILLSTPEERFDISNWFQHTSCGTVCCVAGLAALDPQFQAEGFAIADVGAISFDKLVMFSSDLEELFPVYSGRWSWEAVQEFFDLTYTEATYIMRRSSYPSLHPVVLKDVIVHLDEIVSHHTQPTLEA